MQLKQTFAKDNIEKLNEDIKLMQYRLTRIVSSGIEHFVDLKVSHVPDYGLELAKRRKEAKEIAQAVVSFEEKPMENIKKAWNNLEIILDNPLNCVLRAGERTGKVKLVFSRVPSSDDNSHKVTDLPEDFRFFVSENYQVPNPA
jgi:transcriptional regulator